MNRVNPLGRGFFLQICMNQSHSSIGKYFFLVHKSKDELHIKSPKWKEVIRRDVELIWLRNLWINEKPLPPPQSLLFFSIASLFCEWSRLNKQQNLDFRIYDIFSDTSILPIKDNHSRLEHQSVYSHSLINQNRI